MKAYAVGFLVLVGLLFHAGEAEALQWKAPKLWGVAYGAFRDGQSPIGEYPSKAEIKQDMRILRDFTFNIRTYSVNETQQLIPRLAKQKHMKCYAGAHIGGDQAANAVEIERLLRVARYCRRGGIVIGNEVLFHGNLPRGDLVEWIRYAKTDEMVRRKGIPVGYADVYETFLADPGLVAELDFLLVHVHPYWEGLPVEAAAQYAYDAWLLVKSAYPGKEVILGETGWPTAGDTVGDAVPSEENQRIFLEDFVTLALAGNVPYFFFAAFDEWWKRDASGVEAEAHWGLWYSEREMKRRIADFFTSPPPLIEISRAPRCVAGLDVMPSIGGRVYGIPRSERRSYGVVLYARTNQWYVQPFVDRPLTRIRRSLIWANRTHPGEVYSALLVREGYLPSPTLQQLPEPDGDVLAVAVKDCR